VQGTCVIGCFPEMFRDTCGTNGPIVSGRGIQLPEIVYSDACRHLVIREISLHKALHIDEWDCVYAGTGYTRTFRYPWHIPLLRLFYQLRGGLFRRTSWNKGYSRAVSGRDCGTIDDVVHALEDAINIPQALADVKCFARRE
jgi:hypothetical protein